MLVVSLADFAANPSKYADKSFSFENGGKKWIVRPVRESFFKRFCDEALSPLLIRLGLKNRQLGTLKGKINTDFLDVELTPEDLFDDIDDLNGSMKNFGGR